MADRDEHPDVPPPPGRRSRRWFLGAAVVGTAAGTAGLWFRGCGADGQQIPPTEMDLTDLAPPKGGKRDLTFFVAADTHFGAGGIEALNRKQIEAMNALPGAPLPAALGGTVGRPRGVLIAGDLTDYGRAGQWKQFVEHYGLTGQDGLLKYPVQECTGNHDRYHAEWSDVLAGVQKRHGTLVRGWVWQGVCFLCLDMYPDGPACRWLASQLKTLGRAYPLVMYFHYPFVGPYSSGWTDQEKSAFADVIAGHNVLGVFHGHFHASQRYEWEGFDVYNVGSPRHSWHSFATVHVTDSEMTVASLWWDQAPPGTGGLAVPATSQPVPGTWFWIHRKAITTTRLGGTPKGS